MSTTEFPDFGGARFAVKHLLPTPFKEVCYLHMFLQHEDTRLYLCRVASVVLLLKLKCVWTLRT